MIRDTLLKAGRWAKVQGGREVHNAKGDAVKGCETETSLLERITLLERQLVLSERHHMAAFWHSLDKVYDIALPHMTLSCIVCGYSGQRDRFTIRTSECVFGGGKLERYECPKCEVVFGAQKFLDQAEKIINLDYELLYSRYQEANTTENEVKTFHALSPDRNQHYVNWGCGAWNDTISLLRSQGWSLWGYEPTSATAVDFVATRKEQLPDTVGGIIS